PLCATQKLERRFD
ncbi:hypothetical protein D018_5211B, partial [Vibrio parahaemolyticus VP2007-007]